MDDFLELASWAKAFVLWAVKDEGQEELPEAHGGTMAEPSSGRGGLRILYLVDSDKAHLPEFGAYSRYFGKDMRVERLGCGEIGRRKDLGEAVVWQFMGVNCRRIPAACVVHDYRSLSTGMCADIKDRIKVAFNHRPDIRVFLNEQVRDSFGFRDDVPSVLLDMGVPEQIGQYVEAPAVYGWDFCYVGAVSRDRSSHRMIDAFLKSPLCKGKLLLVGRVEGWIRKRYEGLDAVEFAGTMSQDEVFARVRASRYAVCHLPRRRPYTIQTPTKLLEYASMGKRILANRQDSNERCAAKWGIRVIWTGESIFDGLVLRGDEPDNVGFDWRRLRWDEVIRASGIDRHLGEVTDHGRGCGKRREKESP